MGPGREPKECENEELVFEFECACRGGDYEFAEGYKEEILRRLGQRYMINQEKYATEFVTTVEAECAKLGGKIVSRQIKALCTVVAKELFELRAAHKSD